jgi:hypothetical protein
MVLNETVNILQSPQCYYCTLYIRMTGHINNVSKIYQLIEKLLRHRYTRSNSRMYMIIFSFFSWGATESTWYCGHCLVYCTSHRWWRWLWNNGWNANCQGKPKYSEKTCLSATLYITNPTWPDPSWNPGRLGGKRTGNRLSYGTASDLSMSSVRKEPESSVPLVPKPRLHMIKIQLTTYIRNFHLNVILQSNIRPSKWLYSKGFPTKIMSAILVQKS